MDISKVISLAEQIGTILSEIETEEESPEGQAIIADIKDAVARLMNHATSSAPATPNS